MNVFQRRVVLLFAALSMSAASFADPVDAVIRRAMKEQHLPGVALMIGRRGRLIKHAEYGLASIELHVPVTAETLFPIASASKPFSSTAVFMLLARGKFTLDDPITGLLAGLPGSWADVTVRHLLTHTSGLPDIAVQPGREPLIAATREEALAKVVTMPRPFASGEKWSYNQTNYMLLLMLVEKFGGQPFAEFMGERLFKPIGLTHTVYGDADDVIDRRTSMYEYDSGVMRPRQSRFPEFVRGAAGINTTAGDLYLWADAWAHGRVLAPFELDRQWSPARLASGETVRLGKTMSYGCGLLIDTTEGRRSVGHSGGGNAAFRYFLDGDLLVVVLTNGKTNPDSLLESIAAVVL